MQKAHLHLIKWAIKRGYSVAIEFKTPSPVVDRFAEQRCRPSLCIICDTWINQRPMNALPVYDGCLDIPRLAREFLHLARDLLGGLCI